MSLRLPIGWRVVLAGTDALRGSVELSERIPDTSLIPTASRACICINVPRRPSIWTWPLCYFSFGFSESSSATWEPFFSENCSWDGILGIAEIILRELVPAVPDLEALELLALPILSDDYWVFFRFWTSILSGTSPDTVGYNGTLLPLPALNSSSFYCSRFLLNFALLAISFSFSSLSFSIMRKYVT